LVDGITRVVAVPPDQRAAAVVALACEIYDVVGWVHVVDGN
jgi:hypothetical protein